MQNQPITKNTEQPNDVVIPSLSQSVSPALVGEFLIIEHQDFNQHTYDSQTDVQPSIAMMQGMSVLGRR